jgi:hypothetical protein
MHIQECGMSQLDISYFNDDETSQKYVQTIYVFKKRYSIQQRGLRNKSEEWNFKHLNIQTQSQNKFKTRIFWVRYIQL